MLIYFASWKKYYKEANELLRYSGAIRPIILSTGVTYLLHTIYLSGRR